MSKKPAIPIDYAEFLSGLKNQIRSAQTKAALSVNQELVMLYWTIGNEILARQSTSGWGSKVIDQLSRDLRKSFPEMKGLSARNLKYMRAFAESWPEKTIVQQAAAQIPWFHNCVLLDKVKKDGERLWYVQQTIENGWSRNVMIAQIESGLFARQGNAISNFQNTLPSAQSDLANQILKDPYNLDFLSLGDDFQERHLQRGLEEHIREFLIELGVGFAYVGSNVHLEVGGDDFYIDLLFYHLQLRCYVVIELKTGKFKPEYAGKMNFYLAAVDDLRRHPDDQPTIGIILCKEKNQVVAEYSLRDMNKPIGVTQHQLTHELPETLQDQLPSIEDLENELIEHENDGSLDTEN